MLDVLKNRNTDMEQMFKDDTGEDAVSYDVEYDYEFYIPEYTEWLENKIEELTMIILRSNNL